MAASGSSWSPASSLRATSVTWTSRTPLLVEVFGYNNICVYFDYPPANYVLPVLWAFTLVFLLAYLAAQWLHMRSDMAQGLISKRVYRGITAMNVFEAFTLIAFSTIFAVSPEGWDRTLYIHTAPFFLLQFGMVSLAISNTWYGIKSGYWKRLDFPKWFNKAAWLYCGVFAAVVLFKVPYGVNAMAGSPFWVNTEGLKSVAGFVDTLFLVCAAAVPMLKAGYLYFIKRDEIAVVRLAPRVAV